MSYAESLEYLYGLQKHGIKPGLDVICGILERLGRPHQAFATIHIGGTNGKGSTAAMTAAMLQAAGHRVGLYTSPHLVDFRERIRIDGVPVAEAAVDDLTQRVRRAAGGSEPTFFEFTTAMAFQHFADRRVGVAVLEVGMGGRFDATNVVTPLVSVVTNVTLDHQDFLGHDLRSIAGEKAGIIKPGVPVVAGRLVPEAAEVIRRTAAAAGARQCAWGRDFLASGDPREGFDYRGLRHVWRGLTCPLSGAHQLENAACALAAIEVASMQGLALGEEAVRTGLTRTEWEGRLEVAERDPVLLLDGAHNPAGGAALAAYLASYRTAHPASRLILVLGMMRDKDWRDFLRPLLPLADAVILTQAQIARAAPVADLAAGLEPGGPAVHQEPVPADALRRARSLAGPDDVICVTGSLMLVGDVKALLRGCGLSPIRG